MNRIFNYPKVIEAFLVLIITCVVIYIPIYHGVGRYYLANPERGFDISFIALLIVNGKEMYALPTTSFIHVLIYSWAIWISDLLGLLETINLDEIVYSDRFEELYTPIVAIGRSLSAFFSAVSTVAIWWLGRSLTSNWLAGVMAAGLFGGSLGLASQANQIGTELPTMALLLIGSCFLVSALKRKDFYAFPLFAACGFFLFLALMTKLQAIFSILILAVLPFLISRNQEQSLLDLKERRSVWWVWSCLILSAPAIIWLASSAEVTSVISYQLFLVLYLLGAIYLYVKRIGGGLRLAVFIGLSIFLGLSLAQYFNFLVPHEWTTHSIANIKEALSKHVLDPNFDETGINFAISLPNHMWGYLSNIMHPRKLVDFENPFLIVFWLVAIGVVVLFSFRKIQAALITLYFLGFSVALSTIYGTRVYIYDYVILVEAWTAIGFSTLFACWYATSKNKWVPTICALSICIFVSGTQLRFRHISFHTANTQSARDVCRTYPSSIKEVSEHLPVDCGKKVLRDFSTFK